MADNLVTIDTLRRAYRDAEAAGDYKTPELGSKLTRRSPKFA